MPPRIDETDDTNPDSAIGYITDMLGIEFRNRLVAAFGGTTIKPPREIGKLADDHVLVRRLGRADAVALIGVMAGEAFYVPHGLPRESRLNAVVSLTRLGKKTTEIARELGISDRHVRRLLSRGGLGGNSLAAQLGVPIGGLARAIKGNPHLLPDPQ